MPCETTAHQALQMYIKNFLPGNVFLEKYFPAKKRRADVVWEDEKMVFEIQYSPISVRELLERNIDYYEMGYSVCWILHETVLSAPIHQFLSPYSYYLTSFSCETTGEITLIEAKRSLFARFITFYKSIF